MTRLGVPVTPAVVGIGVEIVAMTAVVLAGAALVALYLAPEWWAAAGPVLARHGRSGGSWIVGVAIATALAWWLAHRAASVAAAALRREIAGARARMRELPTWPLLASVPMTALNVGARVAVLPILVSAMPNQPHFGPVIVGSFALLYSQLVLPTPAVWQVAPAALAGPEAARCAQRSRIAVIRCHASIPPPLLHVLAARRVR
ncbi:MAG: hypothetical protein M3303_07055 [Gemmatimonadota bacterium]|nr:hypothetical protein [Gemmatimonadota bacterium]